MTARRPASGRPQRWHGREPDGAWSLCLPVGWAQIPVADPAATARAVGDVEAHQLSGAEPALRRRVRCDLLRAARQARGADGRLLGVSTTTVAGVPLDATVLVHVLPGLRRQGQPRVTALERLASSLGRGEHLQVPAGPALRAVRTVEHPGLQVEYWVAGRSRTYYLTFRSSLVALAGPLTAMFDAVVATLAEVR